jgi:hypothetical protein
VQFKTGEIRRAWIFVAGLGFSQLLYAWAAEDMKSRNWLASHRRMFAYYGGVPHVTVPDCLKQGVLKCHLYDPDLNPGYAHLATDYATAVVPARPDHPKDKAIVEGLVKILMRYVRFRYRHRRFTSIPEINRALAECTERINDRRHSRFGVSRRERFETLERAALKPLPVGDVDCGEWKDAKLHADCYIFLEGDYYSAPHIHRHKKLRVKITENQVEIFLRLERLAIHPRSRHRNGRRIKIEAHFPAASQAYYEATPQRLLSQSRFIHPELNRLFVELFNADLYGNIRRCQGFVRTGTKEINQTGHELASERIAAAIASMRRYSKFRVPYFQALLAQARKQALEPETGREIVRRPGNPMLRYVAGAPRRRRRCPHRHFHPGELRSMSTAIAKNLMAEMKLLGMLGAFDKVLNDSTRDQSSYSELLDALLQAEADYRQERKTGYRDKLAKPDLVILDDMGMRKLSATEAQDLCELLEERSINKSTLFTTQLPLDHWSEVIADPVIADAIRDRLEHSALAIHITGESYRGVKARKLASKKKDS